MPACLLRRKAAISTVLLDAKARRWAHPGGESTFGASKSLGPSQRHQSTTCGRELGRSWHSACRQRTVFSTVSSDRQIDRSCDFYSRNNFRCVDTSFSRELFQQYFVSVCRVCFVEELNLMTSSQFLPPSSAEAI